MESLLECFLIQLSLRWGLRVFFTIIILVISTAVDLLLLQQKSFRENQHVFNLAQCNLKSVLEWIKHYESSELQIILLRFRLMLWNGRCALLQKPVNVHFCRNQKPEMCTSAETMDRLSNYLLYMFQIFSKRNLLKDSSLRIRVLVNTALKVTVSQSSAEGGNSYKM